MLANILHYRAFIRFSAWLGFFRVSFFFFFLDGDVDDDDNDNEDARFPDDREKACTRDLECGASRVHRNVDKEDDEWHTRRGG